MRNWPTLLLAAALAAIQYPLWLGKGGVLRNGDAQRRLDDQRRTNHALEARNAALEAEVRDLKNGFDAIEEHARHELGLIKADEIFVQIPQR
ncbi:MAG: hypothetical protein OHK0026_06680 [Rhodocyclaceae bacterium]